MSSSDWRGPKGLGGSHSWGSNCLSRGDWRRAKRLRRRHWWRSQLVQRVHMLEGLLGMAEETERRLQHGLWAWQTGEIMAAVTVADRRRSVISAVFCTLVVRCIPVLQL